MQRHVPVRIVGDGVLSKIAESRPQVERLIYRAPQEGRDYWVLDDVLADPDGVRQRLLARSDWVLGAPHRPETWPGMRTQPALSPAELLPIESWFLKQSGRKRILPVVPALGGQFNHNCAQLVSAREGQIRPHTDARSLCTHAAVLFLSPNAPSFSGTSFYRVRMPDGSLGGNVIPSKFNNLVEAFGTRFVPPNLFVEEFRVEPKYNRLVVFKSDRIHSASGYFGEALEERRLTLVFFWMAR
jgi:hypothetical protein